MEEKGRIGEQNLAHVSPGMEQDKYKQVIVVRKDLGMSPGKLAAQVSHASMAFLTRKIQQSAKKTNECVMSELYFDEGVYDGWLAGVFTKVVLSAKNKNKLAKVVSDAEAAGMVEGEDFFVIRDHCLTELVPEEIDEDGNGWTATCIGFAPMPSSKIDPITSKLQLLH